MAFRQFGAEEIEALTQVVESQELWRGLGQGNYASGLEDAFAKHTGRSYVLGVNSGTSANETALAACGLERGEEVIVPPCSFIASSLAAIALGAVPVFVDVDPGNLIITAEAIEAAITPKAKVVAVVHLWGIPADLAPILEVAAKHGLKVVEDCAQAYDAYYRGRMVGTFGDVACYSLQQSKHITSGEGGLVTTDDPDAYRRAYLYANCGMPWYRYGLERPQPSDVAGVATRGHFAYGHNHRMSELQAAVAVTQLARIDTFNARRAENVAAVEEELGSVAGIRLAHTYPDTKPKYWYYPLSLDPKYASLTTKEVGLSRYAEVNYLEVVFQEMQRRRCTSIGYPLPSYVQYEPGLCPQAEAAAPRISALSIHTSREPQECRADAHRIAEKVTRALAQSPARRA